MSLGIEPERLVRVKYEGLDTNDGSRGRAELGVGIRPVTCPEFWGAWI